MKQVFTSWAAALLLVLTGCSLCPQKPEVTVKPPDLPSYATERCSPLPKLDPSKKYTEEEIRKYHNLAITVHEKCAAKVDAFIKTDAKMKAQANTVNK